MPDFPFQPLEVKDGIIRFQSNRIVRYLLDELTKRGISLTEIVLSVDRGMFSESEYSQLMQLIGYSVCGYCDVTLVPEADKDKAWELSEVLETQTID